LPGIVAVEEEWLPVFAPGYANMSSPLEKPPPNFDLDKGQVRGPTASGFG